MAFHGGLSLAFRNVFYWFRRAIFSLSETLVVTLLLHGFYKATKLYIYF